MTAKKRTTRGSIAVGPLRRGKELMEHSLTEFGTFDVVERPADRRNPRDVVLVLQPRDGSAELRVLLTSDDYTDADIIDRIARVVPPAPDVAPTMLQRFWSFLERWIGWWQ